MTRSRHPSLFISAVLLSVACATGETGPSVPIAATALAPALSSDAGPGIEAPNASEPVESVDPPELLVSGSTVTGRLDRSDRLGSRGYEDHYLLRVRRYETVTIAVSSDEFDTYLMLETPAGEVFINDDGWYHLNSYLVFDAAEDQTCLIRITSYRTEKTGWYTLRVLPGTTPPKAPSETEWGGEGEC